MSKEIEKIGELLKDIPDPIPEPDLSYEIRLQTLHEFEDLAWAEVLEGRITAHEADEAIWCMTYWVEGDEYPFI